MALWLKLTNFNGEPWRVNMDTIGCYYPHIDKDGGSTFLEFPVSGETMQGAHVKETYIEIDDAINNDKSPLRLSNNILPATELGRKELSWGGWGKGDKSN